jgi:TolB-like protein
VSVKKLKVDAVLEGAIYNRNDKVRVTARLVKTNDNSTVWTGEFEKLRRTS